MLGRALGPVAPRVNTSRLMEGSRVMDKHRILGVHITNRATRAHEVQGLLTEYGCNIRVRLGLHETDEKFCSPNGLILLELFGDDKLCDELAEKLGALVGIEVQQMVFDHPE